LKPVSPTTALKLRGIGISILVLLLAVYPQVGGFAQRGSDAAFGVIINPSSIVMKVGDTRQVNVSIINPEKVRGGRVCFGVEGFPTSGFITSFAQPCSNSQQAGFGTILSVEVTPAAAPQTVIANVTASDGTETSYATLTLTVEPAIPAWIPWLGLVLFLLLLGTVIFWKPRERKKKTGRIRGRQAMG
jgi:hypothetical protein